ncbi:MAG: alpha/beta fold hydrolase [Paracoccaceae bacterium]
MDGETGGRRPPRPHGHGARVEAAPGSLPQASAQPEGRAADEPDGPAKAPGANSADATADAKPEAKTGTHDVGPGEGAGAGPRSGAKGGPDVEGEDASPRSDSDRDGSSAGNEEPVPRAALRRFLDATRRGARLLDALRDNRGSEITPTPRDEVWRDGKVRLYRYRRAEPATLGPLLILHGLFARETITDLSPERSIVRRLLEAGCEAFVLDWGAPSRADRCLDFTDYAEDWLGEAIDTVRGLSAGARPALFAVCQGGVFALCHAARHPERVAGLALAVTPVDFHADRADPDPAHGFLNVWLRSMPPDLLHRVIAERGNLSGALSGAMFQGLTPVRTAQKYSAGLFEAAEDSASLETFLRMEAWLADRPAHPGAALLEWLIGLYGENRLVDGRFEIDGTPVDLGRIDCPILNIVATEDHIVPPPCSKALAGLTASRDYRLLEVPTGHVGVLVSARAREVVTPALVDWLEALRQTG